MSACEAVARAVAVIEDREPVVRAWAAFDPDLARAEGRRADGCGGPLTGLVLGVKDIFDTAGWPTSYGSPIYAGHRPRADAAAVAVARRAGAACLGKTVTAELACYHPGPTRNPHRPSHTPGGSSSGSAAAVAAGMVDIAFGTQTAGSVIRPASYCGVFGFKPTYGAVPLTGTKLIAPSLDTIGWFARSAEALELLRLVLTRTPRAPVPSRAPRFGLVRTEQWGAAEPATRDAVERAAERARRAGAEVIDMDLPTRLEGLADKHALVQRYEVARNLAWEYEHHRGLLSIALREYIEQGRDIADRDYDAIQASRRGGREAAARLFADRRLDALITPAAVGEAPAGLSTTGDPRFARAWSLLGLPTVSVPGLTGPTGLPVGVQLVGPVDHDAALIRLAGWLGALLGCPVDS